MKTIICGLGNNAFRTIELLLRLNESVTIITQNQKVDEYLIKKIRSNCKLYIDGDARDEDILKQADLESSNTLLAMTGDDIVNLEICIKAMEINPRITIICRLFNEVLSKELESGFGIKKVLSTSALASQSFVSAAINEDTLFAAKYNDGYLYFELLKIRAGHKFVNMRFDEIEKKYSIKVIFRIGSQFVFAKGSDTAKEDEEIVFIANDKTAYKNLSLTRETLVDRGKKISRSLSFNLFEKIKNISSNVKLIFVSYLLLIIIAVSIFSFGLDLPVIDAFYFTITTTTTIGYGDINLLNAPWSIKLIGSVIMIAGASLLASLFSVITEKLISRRFNQYFGFSNIRLKNHIIIAGLGKIGFRVANQLYENGEKIIVIEKDSNSDFLNSLKGKIPVLIGDSSHPQVLFKSGLNNAKTIMALTDDDLTNLNMLIFARNYNPEIKTVARIFNKHIGKKAREAFKIDKVLSIASLASPTFVASALYHNTFGSFFLNDNLYIIFEINIAEKAAIFGLKVSEILEKYKIFPFLLVNSSGRHQFINNELNKSTQKTLAVGKYEDVKRFLQPIICIA